ncbi:unnamed protein product [Moneuplotes crassus]|uniref:Uncharacterized protein n=1 Tax=Euplotes crassus TaxID=5936 RepID=A0AAD2CX89_EUPCR|nr:unnamed protein product [Moneuplotes crassus]
MQTTNKSADLVLKYSSLSGEKYELTPQLVQETSDIFVAISLEEHEDLCISILKIDHEKSDFVHKLFNYNGCNTKIKAIFCKDIETCKEYEELQHEDILQVVPQEDCFVYTSSNSEDESTRTGTLQLEYIDIAETPLLSEYVIFYTKLHENSIKELGLERVVVIKDSIDLDEDKLSFLSSLCDSHRLNESFRKLIDEQNPAKFIRKLVISNYMTQNYGDNTPMTFEIYHDYKEENVLDYDYIELHKISKLKSISLQSFIESFNGRAKIALKNLKNKFPEENIYSKACGHDHCLIPHTRVFHGKELFDEEDHLYKLEVKFYDSIFNW